MNKYLVKMKLLIILFTVVIIECAFCIDFRVDPLVLIDQGLVRGQKASDGDYSKFLGIRYARVDTENPFGASLSVEPSDSIFYAYDGSIACPQMRVDTEGILDCLRLNIFVPNEANSANPLPVLVWLHGGIFELGKAPDQNVVNLVKHGVMLVTVNYRLGPYGFMCLDDPSVPGNQGFKDQLAALRWVKNNIAAFGGNPFKLTFGGQSAGAASVNHHLYSSQEKIFDKAIIQSAVTQTPTSFVNGDYSAPLKLSQHLGLNTTNITAALKFLANTTPKLVTAASEELQLTFRACKEVSFSGVENFIDTDPYNQLNMNKIRRTPILIGITSKESQGMSFGTTTIAEALSTVFNFNDKELDEAVSLVTHFYLGDDKEDDNISIRDEFRSDFFYNHPIDREITKLLSQNAAPVYEYVFSFVNDGSEGAKHIADMKYLFGEDVVYSDLGEKEKVIADRMGTMWANFVKFGNPIPETDDLLPISWDPATSDSRPYIDINDDLSLKHRFRHQSMAFWDLFYENYSEKNKVSQRCSLL